MSCSLFDVLANGRISFFLWLNNISLCVCVCLYTTVWDKSLISVLLRLVSGDVIFVLLFGTYFPVSSFSSTFVLASV